MTDNYVSKGLRGEAFKREHPINQDDCAPILEEVLGLIQTLDEKMKLLRAAASFDAGKGQPFCAHVEVPRTRELVGSLLNTSCVVSVIRSSIICHSHSGATLPMPIVLLLNVVLAIS